MATYIELRDLANDSVLRNRTDVAVIVAANNLLDGSETVDQAKWASAVFSNPRSVSQKAFMAVLAVNKDALVADIRNSSDAQLQTNVDGVVPALVAAHSAA